MPKVQACSVCGDSGYWVAYDSVSGEDRCINHLSAPTIVLGED